GTRFPRGIDDGGELVHLRAGKEWIIAAAIHPPDSRLELHSFEPGRERPRHGEPLAAVLEQDQGLVAHVALDAEHGSQVDDRAAVNLPEGIGVELLEELLDGLLD